MNATRLSNDRSRGLLAFALVLACMASFAYADWPMLGRDSTRNPVSPEKNPPIDWDVQTGRNIKWKAPIGFYTFADPVVSQGLVWIGSGNPDLDQNSPAAAAGEFLYAIRASEIVHDWPQWRGPDRANYSVETGLLKEWPEEGPPLEWKVTGLGDEIASVAIQHGRLVTLGRHEKMEYVVALSASTGSFQWATALGPTTGRTSSLMRWLSARTPTMDGNLIFAISTEGELACLSAADGQVLWRRNYPGDFKAPAPFWGFCDYPLVDGESLIIAPGGPEASVVALNKQTGDILWQSALPGALRAGYAAPIIIEAGGVRHYVVVLDNLLAGLDPEDGRVLWSREAPSRWHNTYTPIAHGDRLIAPHGYGNVIAALLFEPDRDGALSIHEAYSQQAVLDPFQDSTVPVGDYLYVWKRAHAPACIDLRTGLEVWAADPTGGRRGRAAVTGSDGHLYFLRSDGGMLLVEATPEGYREKGNFLIPDYQQSVGASFPVIAGGRLYVRDGDRLLCYDVRDDALERPQSPPVLIAFSIAAPEKVNGEAASPTPRIGRDRSPDAIYVPTPNDIVAAMLELAAVTREDVVVDLGSGDGRIVIAAAKQYGSRAVGYEIDPRLVSLGRENVARENLGELVRILHEDVFTLDFSDATVIAVYLPSPLLERLLPQFEKLKPGTRIVSHQFEIPGVRPDQSLVIDSTGTGDRHRLFLWTTPLKRTE